MQTTIITGSRRALTALLIAVAMLTTYAVMATATSPPKDKVGICHRTLSEKNPYVYIEVPKDEANGHITGTHKSHNGTGPPDYFANSKADCTKGNPPSTTTTTVPTTATSTTTRTTTATSTTTQPSTTTSTTSTTSSPSGSTSSTSTTSSTTSQPTTTSTSNSSTKPPKTRTTSAPAPSSRTSSPPSELAFTGADPRLVWLGVLLLVLGLSAYWLSRRRRQH